MSTAKISTSSKHVQTTIHCFPHVLLSESQLAKVFSDRGCQTAASATPTERNSSFYAVLEFTPYQSIVENALKEVDLPRRALLQWNLSTAPEHDTISSNSKLIEREESETFRQKGVLKKLNSSLTTTGSFNRVLIHHPFAMQKSVTDQEVQTTLSVSPHVLDTDEVANVFTELSIQTSITCLPNDSISNILPQLKGNLSHASDYHEIQSTGLAPAIVDSITEEEEQDVEKIEEEQTDVEDQAENVEEQEPVEPPEAENVEDNPDAIEPVAPVSSKTMSVTVSASQFKTERGCGCGTRVLNRIASQLRVQASTLKLTPKVFPPGTPFEERMIEVLNTTIAVLQTEMAKLMDICVEEDKAVCACSEKATQKSLEDIKSDPRSCKCGAKAQEDEQQLAIVNDPRSCRCGTKGKSKTEPDNVVSGGQKEIKRITTTRQTVNPNTMQPDFVKEDIIEETTRTITVNDNNETIVEERVVTKTIREKLPGPPDTQRLMLGAASGKTKRPCKCSGVEGATADTETENVPEPESEATEVPLETEELPDEEPPAEDEVVEPPAEEEPPPEELEDEVLAETTEELPPEELNMQEEAAPPAEEEPEVAPDIVGDYKENRRLSYIPCECHPTETGAAAPAIAFPEPSTPQEERQPENDSDVCSCLDSAEASESLTEANACSMGNDEPSMVTDDAPSLADDAPSAEKTIKFEILLKKGIADVKSVSATSAIVIRATISCPDTNKAGKAKATSGSSLPDLREQVIRLSVIYKNEETEQETRTEELLSLGRQITIAPNKYNSRADQRSANVPAPVVSQNVPITDGKICECGRLVCARRPSLMQIGPSYKANNNKRLAAAPYRVGDAPCECAQPGSSRGKPAYNQPFSNLPIEIEEVPFSSMACPVHTKPPSCVPSCTPRSAPSSQPAPTTSEAANKAALEIIISYGIGDHADEEDNLRSPSFMYEHEPAYDEPYMDALNDVEDATTGVQTDLALGDKLESESLSSLVQEEENDGEGTVCDSKTEMPWQKISLPPPGTYSIRPTKGSIQPSSKEEPVIEAEPVVEAEPPVEEAEAEDVEEDEAVDEGEENADQSEAPVEEGEAEEGEVEEGEEQEGDEKKGGDEEPPSEPEPEPEPVVEEPPDEVDVGRARKEPLLFELEVYKDNEPYMEGLYRAFPNSDDEAGECGSQTEMPWKDILLPENCKIRKMKKTKKCTCRSGPEKLSGMFIPTTRPPRRLEDDEDEEQIVEINIGFDQQESTMMPIGDGAAMSQATLSYVSTVSNMQQPHRTPKEFTLLVDLANKNNLSFQAGKGQLQTIPVGGKLGPTASQPYSVSATQETQGKTSSVIVNIKPSQENPFPSEKISVPGDGLCKPGMYLGAVPTETRSCTETCITGETSVKSILKTTSSMPQIPSQRSIKATISLKRLGEPDKVVTQKMNLAPGENLMTLKIPDEPISVKLKMSTPEVQLQSINAIESKVPPPAPPAVPAAQPEEVFSPAKCTCKDKVKLDTFRQDPVMAALEAYEAEMKPLRQALTQLQQKIRNLNMPEMKGCMCSTALGSPQMSPPQRGGMYPTTVRSRIRVSAEPGATTRTTMRVRAHSNSNSTNGYGSQGTCPFFQPAAFRPPQPPAAMYGRLPPPMMPPRNQPYMTSPPNYMPPNVGEHQRNCFCERGESRHSRSGGHRRQSKERRSSKGCGKGYPGEDLAMQARQHGMYPDYRGRKYPDEQMAYQDSYVDESRQRRGSRDKYKVRNVVSVHSSGNATSDSQGASDGEELCPLVVERRRSDQRANRSHHGRKHKNSSKTSSRSSRLDNCTPCKEYADTQQLREGQALKTGPEEFLAKSSCSSRRRSREGPSTPSYTMPKVVSRSKIQIKFPRS